MCKDLEISNRLFIDDLEQYPRNTEGWKVTGPVRPGLVCVILACPLPHAVCLLFKQLSCDVLGCLSEVPQSMEMKHHYSFR